MNEPQLLQALEGLWEQLCRQHDALRADAVRQGIDISLMRDRDGKFSATSVLVAKADVLLAITKLKDGYGRIW